MPDVQNNLAVLVYRRDQDPDSVLSEFAASLFQQGARVAGLIQFGHYNFNTPQLYATLVHTGEKLKLFRDLAVLTRGGRLNIETLMYAGRQIATAVEDGADLLILNRFGRLERHGEGLSYIVRQALNAGVPTVVAVFERHFSDWLKFAGIQCIRLPCDGGSLERWWNSIPVRSSDTARPDCLTMDSPAEP